MSQTKAQLIDAVDGSIVTADLADDAVNAAKLASNAVVNASVDASAAIAGSKINPSFTSNVTITNTAPALVLVDSDHNSDFNIQASGGLLNFNDSTNSATRISITSDGKVNFGSVARVEADGVFKAANGDASTPAYNFLNDNDNGMFRATTNTIGFSTAGTERMRIDSSGHVLPATDSTYNIGADATRFANGYFDTLYGDGSNLTGITGITINSNADNRLITATGNANTLNGEANLTFDGNSLITTQTTSSSDCKVIIRNSNTPASGVLRLEFHHGTGSTEGTNRFRYGFIEGFRQSGSNDGGLIFGSKPSNAGAPTERMRITSAGKVGIGTTSPSSALEVSRASGDTIFELNRSNSNVSGNVGCINFTASDGHSVGSIGMLGDGDDQGADIVFRTTSAAADNSPFNAATPERMRIDSSGNVGIGTSSPNAKLQVSGGHINIDSGYSYQWGDSHERIEQSDGKIEFFTGNSEKMTLSGSNLGIGTTSPSDLLHVAGNIINTTSVSSTGDSGIQIANNHRLGFDQSGTRSWSIKATGGVLNIDSGDGNSAPRVRGLLFGSDTADANKLDDYEEGTFAPMTATQAEVYHARYTKVGNKVTINTCFEMKNNQNRQFISLPFLPNNDNAGANNNLQSAVNNRYAGTVSFFDNGTTVVNLMLFHQGNQGSSAYFLAQNQNGSQTWPKTVDNNDFGKIGVSFTYQTAA